MKNKLKEVSEYLIFIMFFLVILIPLMVAGAINTPIRFFKYTINTGNNKKSKKYWY